MQEQMNEIKRIATEAGMWINDNEITKGKKKIRVMKISVVMEG